MYLISSSYLSSFLSKINIVNSEMKLRKKRRGYTSLAINPLDHHLIAISDLNVKTDLYDTRTMKRFVSVYHQQGACTLWYMCANHLKLFNFNLPDNVTYRHSEHRIIM